MMQSSADGRRFCTKCNKRTEGAYRSTKVGLLRFCTEGDHWAEQSPDEVEALTKRAA